MDAVAITDSTAGRRVVTGTDRARSLEKSNTQRAATVDRSRIDTLDAARLVALIAIIFIHTVESPELRRVSLIGTFGVPFYLFAALYFQARSFRRNPHRPFHRYVADRIYRLYLPFLAWSAIYLVARDLKHLFIVRDGAVHASVPELWIGTAHHLWFLPLLLVVTIMTAALSRMCGESPTLR